MTDPMTLEKARATIAIPETEYERMTGHPLGQRTFAYGFLEGHAAASREIKDELKESVNLQKEINARIDGLGKQLQAEREAAKGLVRAVEELHRWLEQIDTNAIRFGLDHQIGKNVDGCEGCGSVAHYRAAREGGENNG